MTNPKELNIKLLDVTAIDHFRNEFFSNGSNHEPHALVTAEINSKQVTLALPVLRNDVTHQISAAIPLGGYCAGIANNTILKAAGLGLGQLLAAYGELARLVNEKLRFERTEDDRITEGLLSHKADILNMYELSTCGNDYDGAEYDETDDFHKWLIKNEFAEVDTDDETGEKTLMLFGDWEDRLSDYFGNYFLSVQIANTPEGDAPCVEAVICFGGPNCYLRQMFGRGYSLIYSWGGLSDSYEFDAELDGWLDDMLGTFVGHY